MGGFFLAKELAGGDVAARCTRPDLGSMMGPTIVFSIPVALGIIEPTDRRWLALGVLAGIVTIPIGCTPAVWWRCIPGGDQRPAGRVYLRADPDEYDPGDHRRRAGGAGAEVYSGKMINGFQIFAKFLVALITIGGGGDQVPARLGADPGLDPIFMAPGDQPGEVMRAIEVMALSPACCSALIRWCSC